MVTTEKKSTRGLIQAVEFGHVGIPLTGFMGSVGGSWLKDPSLMIIKGNATTLYSRTKTFLSRQCFSTKSTVPVPVE